MTFAFDPMENTFQLRLEEVQPSAPSSFLPEESGPLLTMVSLPSSHPQIKRTKFLDELPKAPKGAKKRLGYKPPSPRIPKNKKISHSDMLTDSDRHRKLISDAKQKMKARATEKMQRKNSPLTSVARKVTVVSDNSAWEHETAAAVAAIENMMAAGKVETLSIESHQSEQNPESSYDLSTVGAGDEYEPKEIEIPRPSEHAIAVIDDVAAAISQYTAARCARRDISIAERDHHLKQFAADLRNAPPGMSAVEVFWDLIEKIEGSHQTERLIRQKMSKIHDRDMALYAQRWEFTKEPSPSPVPTVPVDDPEQEDLADLNEDSVLLSNVAEHDEDGVVPSEPDHDEDILKKQTHKPLGLPEFAHVDQSDAGKSYSTLLSELQFQQQNFEQDWDDVAMEIEIV